MFESFVGDASRRDVLKASAVGVGASMGLVGTASAAADVVEFDESITITPEDSGKTFVQTADFDGRIRIRSEAEDVTVDGNGYTISGGGVSGGDFDGNSIVNLTVQNLHLSDGSFYLEQLDDLVVRNNLVQQLELQHTGGARVVDNTVTGLILMVENQFENVLARNVAAGIRLWDDLGGSHRVSNNFITGHERGSGITVAVANREEGRLRILDNYVANAEDAGIDLEETRDLRPEISGNVVIGSGSHGLRANDRVASVTWNAFVGNGGDGVSPSLGGGERDGSFGTFRNNVAMSNDGVGFDVILDGDGDCLRNAAVSNGGDGFRVESDGAEVKFNRATGNGGDGVVLSGSGFPFRKNDVTANGGDGLVVGADDVGITRNYICGNDGEQLVDDGDDNRFENNIVC